jgi:BirA family transcriptional regulator, biotin operon repressor / biotin---[acetyl-CoA-carboxylase] ligase
MGKRDNIHYFKEVDSTMDEARKLARQGCPSFTVVVAERQRRGRGRMERTWLSDEGGLYFTLVVRPALSPSQCGRLNFLASVVLAGLLRDLGIQAGVKWPNDILVEGKKLAGMLSEMDTDGKTVRHLAIGIGLNVNNDPSPLEPRATSLKDLLGKRISRSLLLQSFLDSLEAAMARMDWQETLSSWRRLTVTLNRPVRVETSKETVEGTALDVDDTGALVVQLSDGSVRRIVYGDCFIKNPEQDSMPAGGEAREGQG